MNALMFLFTMGCVGAPKCLFYGQGCDEGALPACPGWQPVVLWVLWAWCWWDEGTETPPGQPHTLPQVCLVWHRVGLLTALLCAAAGVL